MGSRHPARHDPVTEDQWPPPSAAMTAVIDDVVRTYPVAPDEGSEDSPWAWSPLSKTASGDVADLTLTWTGHRRASLVNTGVAARHGVICLDTESRRIVDPPRRPVLPVSGPSHAHLLRQLGAALAPEGFTAKPTALEMPFDDGLMAGIGLRGVIADVSRAVWVSVGLVDAAMWTQGGGGIP